MLFDFFDCKQYFTPMKNLLFILFLIPAIMISCESFPEAGFEVDTVSPEVGQAVYFSSCSHNAHEYEWDFGDGVVSYEPDPFHFYTGTGTFEVTLTVYSHTGDSDQTSLMIDVMIPTLLEITVLEYYDEYVVPDASVRLYPTLLDWEFERDLQAEGYTDNEGLVVFSHLGPYVYYVDVWETNHDNYILKKDDVAFIRTSEIMPNKINRFTAWVDVVDHGKSGRTGKKDYIIKKIERSNTEKQSPFPTSINEEWAAMYEKSIKLKK